MAALTSPRNTVQRAGDVLAFPVKAATTIHQGCLVVLDAGHAAPGRVATGLVAQADVGADCYVVDDQTVARTSATNTRSRAGIVVAVEPDGVWVQIGLGL